MATELANKKAEREALRGVIQQWNANRLDLFELSEPNEDLEFHGVMRFYFQDSGQKVATKCIRVASDATSQAVIETLIEKFRPDMRMLSIPEYALYEIHENGEERKLGLEEKPLLVQLNWHIDDREGRFLLRRIDDKTNAQGVGFSSAEGTSFRRKLSKREKKQIKKQEKLSRLKSLEQDENAAPDDQNGVAEKLYTELPETSFTRSISNPEAVMRRRRQQKLEIRLQQFRSKNGGPDTGGTLKIYGEALCKDVPYKTLLLSVRDSAAQVVREMLSKYGLDKVDPQLYCLVQVNSENISGNAHQEYILDDDECPLAILMNHPSTRGSIMFHVRRRPADYMPRKRKKKPSGKWNELDHRYEDERLPFLLELNPDGSDIPNGAGVRHRLQPNVTEVGSERPIGPQAVQAQTLTLPGPTVMPRHCVIAFTENIVTLTPCSRDAHTYVNNQRIHQTTILQNGAIIKFGRMHTFRFIDPAPEDRIRQRHDSNKQIDYAYDRRSPDATSQDVSSEKFRPGSGTPNGGGQTPSQAQERATPSSPSKSAIIAARSPRSPTHPPEPTHNYETTFDLDGNVETASLSSSRDGNRPELQPTERAHRLTAMLANVATMIQRVIQERYMDASSLAFWLANSSELLHMLKSDRHVGAFSTRAQDILKEAVHAAFGSLVRCVTLELTPAMTQFMADADEPAKEAGVLQIFSNTMALLRRCRVNAALTIQLFSHLFHAINATAFNTLVSNGNLCVRWFGRRLKARLNALETWAERQGLELASQCHLATIMQATHLLQAPKYNAEELATLSSTCFKLNSLQDGRLTAGDQLLKVDGQSLVGITQEKAAEYLVRTGPIVTLEVAKQGAIYHGLATLLSQPSPIMTRACKTRPRSEHLEQPIEAAETAGGGQPAASHSVGDLLSFPKQAACQDLTQPGAIPSQRIVETSFYRNFPRVDYNEYRYPMRQDAFTVFRPRGAYASAYPVERQYGAFDDREYVYRPSTPTVSPMRIPRPHMPCPLISITSDNEISSVIYQDESDESDDKIVEEDEDNAEQGGINNSSYSTLSPFERISPPREYAEPAQDYKLLAPPLTFDRNFYDAIPYIDQNDDANLAEASESVQAKSRNRYERYKEAACNSNSNLRDSQKRMDVGRSEQTLNIADSDLRVQPGNFSSSAIDTYSLSVNESASSVRHATNGSSTKSRMDDFLHLRDASNSTRHALSVENEQYENKSDDVTNSEDCADESSSTINDECASIRVDGNVEEEGISTPKMYTIMPELHLDLTGLNSDVSSDESKTEKCWKSPEEVRLGGGRVAALAKHFSKLGDAGLIRFKPTKLTDSRQFVSEPEIATPEKSDERLYGPCRAQKEYKSDSDLTRDENSQVDSDGRRKVILFDVETGELAIQECRFHRCGAKWVTAARIPSLNDFFTTKNTTLAEVEDCNDMATDNSKSQNCIKAESHENEPTNNKLSVEQQQVIVEQLEQFSNLDNTDAPLFIPDQKVEQTFSKNENEVSASVNSVNFVKDDSFQNRKQKVTSSSSSSVRLPSRSSIVLALSKNVAKSAPSLSENSKVQSCGKRAKSCLFIDLSHSSAKNCSSNGSSEHSLMFPPRASTYSRLKDDKLNILRVRIARPCSSEDNLISAAICQQKIEEAMDRRDDFVKLTRSYDSILNNKFLLDSTDQTRSSESLYKSVDLPDESCDRSGLAAKQEAHWYRHRSLEELKPKRASKKQGSLINFTSVQPAAVQTRLSKSFDDKLNSEDGDEMRWNCHGSLEELKSSRRDSRTDLTDSGRVAKAQKFDWTPKKRFRTKRGSHDRLIGSALELSRVNRMKDEERQEWRVERKSRSELDIPRHKSDSERDGWSFREISSLKDDDQSTLRPRRMSERDLPSRLGHDATPQQIHSSKSVPALHNIGTEAKQQHEIFNPGYSRASSSNSVTPPVQPPPMAAISSATALRSRSSHNLHDPMRIGTLPPSGLVSRQQSSPNLNPNATHTNVPSSVQNTEAERFYQNLSIYRNQDPAVKQQISPQQSDDRNSQHIQKSSLRGSQNSLNRPSTLEIGGHMRDRPTSAYISQGQPQSYSAVSSQMQQQSGGLPPRSQSSRDIIRQEAKMQEMQEEVRRRELRGGAPILNQHRPPMYNIGARVAAPPPQQMSGVLNVRSSRPGGSMSNLGITSNYAVRQNVPGYNYPDTQYAHYNSAQYGQYGQYNQYPKYPAASGQYGPMMLKPKSEAMTRGHQSMPGENLLGKDASNQEAKPYAEQNRHFAGSQNSSHYPNGNLEQRVDQYTNDIINRAQNGDGHSMTTSEAPPTRPALPSEDTFNESPPPPPPNTSTHPLYNKPADTRYTASMQDPPRGSYYPAGGISAMQQPRQYQYSATNPWQREEREKEQARRREAARQWRDQQIAELSVLTHRTQQQEEQLRALQLERDFQKRAEEAANQDDDEESNDLDNESAQRVQGLLRMAASQERAVQGSQQPPILSRTNTGNQSMRGGLPLQPINSPPVSHAHVPPTVSLNVGMSGQENSSLHVQPSPQQQQQQQTALAQIEEQQLHVTPNYGASLSHFGSGQKPYSVGAPSIEDRELQRRMDEAKRKQIEFEENQKKQEEQMHAQQQTYQQNQHSRNQQLHPDMLRLDNLIINGPSVPMSSQNNINDAPPPPERGSSYAVMSQQSALRSNGSTASNLPPSFQQPASMKRVSFHDSNANSEPLLRNVQSGTSNPSSMSMDTIREDPNNFINDAETLLASPKTPEGSGTSFTGATPGVIGAQEVYKDPRQKRLAEKQKQQQNSQIGAVPEKLSFKEKMKMFAMETGEDGTPRDKVKISRAQREIDNISSPLNPNSNNNNNTISGNSNTNNNRT
ncbi:hypothetical protein DMN91_008735 [Ooceraea biroi]|uniref:Afadin n=1 Tax=Ooceraea biroi TaxID=2015173 RepID=A0A3L8DEN5_OOCBI|nr:hypothetical protein DMN91_008735 [Ooceraea biroi]